MSAVKALYAIDVFAENQLGNAEPTLHQGIDIYAECEYTPVKANE